MSQVKKSHIKMYCTSSCPFCNNAEKLLLKKGAEIEKIDIDAEPERKQEMIDLSGGRDSVPQIFIDDKHIGGFDDLSELDMDDELDCLL